MVVRCNHVDLAAERDLIGWVYVPLYNILNVTPL